jgi:hypothetical protein
MSSLFDSVLFPNAEVSLKVSVCSGVVEALTQTFVISKTRLPCAGGQIRALAPAVGGRNQALSTAKNRACE